MNVDYSSYYYNQKTKKKQPNFKVIFIVLIIIACFGSFFFLYPKLTADTPYVRALPQKGQVEVFEQFFYAVEIGKFTTEGSAKAFSESIQSMGGAGYIWDENGAFCVLTSLYFTQENAEKVATKLKNSGYKASVFPLVIPHTYISVAAKQSEVSKCLGYTFELLQRLEGLNLDMATSKTNLKSALTALDSNRKGITDLMTYFDSSGVNSVQNSAIRTYYLWIVSSLDELKTSATQESELLKDIRHLSLDVLQKFINLVSSL